jgi:formate dehydrogenase major subunit
VVTTDNSDWATNCPEYSDRVQVSRVAQPSEWQRQFTEFDKRQHELLPSHEQAT